MDLETKAALGKGRWIAHEDMDPATNVSDRLYRTKDGDVHRAYEFPLMFEPQAWFFEDKD